MGELYLAKFARTDGTDDASAAADAFGRAVSLYPSQAAAQAGLGESLWKAGSRGAASTAARRALELDAINERAGHIDKRLPDSKRRLMKRIVEDT